MKPLFIITLIFLPLTMFCQILFPRVEKTKEPKKHVIHCESAPLDTVIKFTLKQKGLKVLVAKDYKLPTHLVSGRFWLETPVDLMMRRFMAVNNGEKFCYLFSEGVIMLVPCNNKWYKIADEYHKTR